MSNKIKVARATEQEYAHNYNSKDHQDYQYKDEDKRVGYHVNSDTENDLSTDELYNVQPESTLTDTKPTNKIRARLTSTQVLEEHRQRSYKVNYKAQVYDKTDPGKEAYALNEDVRDVEINYIKNSSADFDARIKEEQSRDLTKPEDRYAEFQNEKTKAQEVKELLVGAKVKHKEEGIKGEVKFIGSDKVSVVWEDQTRERISISEAKSSLEILSYVDDAQTQVDPLGTTPFPKTENEDERINKETDDVLDMALAALDEEVNLEDDEDTIAKIKKKAAMELVDLMQSKGLLEKNKEAEESQAKAIIAMSDTEFEAFKNKVVANKVDAMDMALLGLDQDDDFSDIEDGNAYAKMREKVVKAAEKQSRTVDGIMMGDTSMFESGTFKASEFKASVGDFSSQTNSSIPSTNNTGQNETRSLRRSDSVKTAAPQQSQKQLDFSGFAGLEGLTKPINIPNKEVTAKAKFNDVFSDPGFWTTISKIH